MKIYSIIGSQSYWSVYYKKEDKQVRNAKYKIYQGGAKGIPLAKDWEKIECEIVFRGEYGKVKPDIMDLGGFAGIVITAHTAEILEDLLLPVCELLPMELEGTLVYLINPIIVLECLDYSRIVTKRIAPFYEEEISKYAFIKEREYPSIFKINDKYSCFPWPRKTFVNEEFVKRLEENKLIGYEVWKVWDSDE